MAVWKSTFSQRKSTSSDCRPNSGRKRGTPNKSTQLQRAGVKSAIEICRSGDGTDPITIMVKGARVLSALADYKLAGNVKAMWETVTREDFDRVVECVKESVNAAAKAAQFGYPKLKAFEYLGDAPTIQNNKTKIIVELKLDSREDDTPITIDGDVDYRT